MKEIDTRGLTCPMPLIRLKKALRDEDYNGEWAVLTDNDTALQNITDYLSREGVSFTTGEEGHATRIFFSFSTADQPIPVNEEPGEYIVVIAGDEMGHGEPELGRLLLRSFINALEAQEVLPERVILYNKGVLMCKKRTDTGESLARLEALGVKISLCGTCTDYYDFADQMACGSVSNLLTISTWLRKANRIVKP